MRSTDGGGLRAVRWPGGSWLLLAVVTGFAAYVAVLRIPRPVTWRYETVVFVAPLAAISVLAIGASLLFRRRPRLLVDCERQVLVAPPRQWRTACQLSIRLLALAQAVVLMRSLEPVNWFRWSAVAGVGFGVVAARVGVWLLRRPRVELSPSEVRVIDPFGTWRVPWEAIAVGPRLSPPGWPELLTVDRADLLTRRGLTYRPRRAVQLPTVDTDTTFLARAVNYYLDRPQERDTIATAAGYDRLLEWMRTAESLTA